MIPQGFGPCSNPFSNALAGILLKQIGLGWVQFQTLENQPLVGTRSKGQSPRGQGPINQSPMGQSPALSSLFMIPSTHQSLLKRFARPMLFCSPALLVDHFVC